MGVPYEIPPLSGLEVAGGQDRVFAVDFPSRTIITKIVVIQYDGALADVTVALYNHRSVLEGEQTSDSVGPEVGPVPSDCYRVTPDLHGTAGKLFYFSGSGGGGGFAFYSQDRPLPERNVGSTRKLYVKVAPSGTGPKKFAVCIGGEQNLD